MAELEERYIVVKRSHISEHQEQCLREFLLSWGEPIGTIGCVVVEEDWDMYQEVVERVLGA